MHRSTAGLCLGVFLLVAAVYAGLGSGRIDMIDGQFRFEVAHNLVAFGVPEVRDPELRGGPTTADGRRYSMTQLTTSLSGVPLVALARALGPESLAREHFFFSLTSGLVTAATATLLVRFYLVLGVAAGPAVFWTLVFAFATLMFPKATSVFDQAQHGFVLLLACYLGFTGARRDSLMLTALGGVVLGLFVSFRELYVAIVPALAIVTLAAPQAPTGARRRALLRYLAFTGASATGVLVWMTVNYLQATDPFASLKAATAVLAPFDNPALGAVTLLVSPGKGLLLYSPAIVLALFGLKRLLKSEQRLAEAVVTVAVLYVLLIGSLSFFAGDWCWGPRYLVPVLPLVALGFPMVRMSRPSTRMLVGATIMASLAIQLLAISLDHHRFFYGRSLRAYFWYRNSAFYFRDSALLARPAEIVESLTTRVPPEATSFRPGPYPNVVTYAVVGDDREPAPPTWMRRYQVFWLPRPWPLWMSTLARADRPIDIELARTIVLTGALAGVVALGLGLRPQGEPGTSRQPRLEPIGAAASHIPRRS